MKTDLKSVIAKAMWGFESLRPHHRLSLPSAIRKVFDITRRADNRAFPAGQYNGVAFRAEMDCDVVFSACPQDILPIHGEAGAPPVDARFEVLD